MAVRPGMAWLIAEVRSLTGAPTTITDQQIQDKLDRYRIHLRLQRLVPLDTIMLGGQLRYYEFTSPYQYWEDSVQIQNSGNTKSGVIQGDGSAWQIVTPADQNLIDGRWTFDDWFYSDLFITGYSYCPFAAGADVLDLMATSQLNRFDFSAAGQSFSRSQILKNYRDQAQALRAQARVIPAELYRGDQ